MRLEIVTPERIIYSGDVDQIALTTETGKITVLPHHVNLFTKVVPGEVTITIANREQFMAITGGFLEIANNKITILADYAVNADEINVEKVLAAQKRAEELLKRKEENLSEQDFAEARAELSRAILELHIANRRKRKNL